MRRLLLLFLLPAVLAASDELRKVKSVYLLPMTNGLDQYLANRLIGAGSYVITTDPQAADAVFTDSLGPGFEQAMAELFPPPKSEDDKEGTIESRDDAEVGRMRSFRKGRGTVFLVDRRTRQVVWSTYRPPKDLRPEKLDEAAREIAERLKKELIAHTVQ